MERVLMTNLTPDELRDLIADVFTSLIKNQNAAQDNVPGPAAPIHVTKREAARLLSCSQSTVSNLARAGKLKRFYAGKSVRFLRTEVLSLIKSHENTRARKAG